MSPDAHAEDRLRVVVTGAAGMLGQAVVAQWGARHEVIPQRRADADLTDAGACIEWITQARPQVIVHCAAWTDVDACEADEDRAFRDNGLATRNVAVAAQRVDASLCYISTDYVFDGSKPQPYREYDAPAPLGVYGRSKRWGEEVVQALVARHWIARTSWLFGPGGRNFVHTMARLLAERKAVRVVDDQQGSPTYSVDLARALAVLVSSGPYGTYHVSNSGQCSWYGLTQRIAAHLGSPCRIDACTTDEFPRPAPRPRNSVLEPWAWRATGLPVLRAWEDAVDEYLDELRREEAVQAKAG